MIEVDHTTLEVKDRTDIPPFHELFSGNFLTNISEDYRILLVNIRPSYVEWWKNAVECLLVCFLGEVDSVGIGFYTAFRVDISHHRSTCFHSSTQGRDAELDLAFFPNSKFNVCAINFSIQGRF